MAINLECEHGLPQFLCRLCGGDDRIDPVAPPGLAGRMKREDIVESVLEPNALVAPQYVTTIIETKSGETYVGLVASEKPDAVTLKVAGGTTHVVKVADIKKREALKVSPMPEGLANGMSPEEFLDLIEFLSPSKPAKKSKDTPKRVPKPKVP